MRYSAQGGSVQDNVLYFSNTCISINPVDLVGGFKPTIYMSFTYKKSVNATSRVVDSNELSLRASN